MSRLISILIVAIASSLSALGQDFNPAENKTVFAGDTTVVFLVKPLSDGFNAKFGKDYYWYMNQKIHHNAGGAYGWLLHGKYRALLAGNRLVEEGSYSNGLKDGVWRCWNSNGNLISVVKYRKGLSVKRIYPATIKEKKSGNSITRIFGKHKADERSTPADSTSANPQ